MNYKEGFGCALPIMISYIGLGIAAGSLAVQYNMSALEVYFVAQLVYAGSAQFAFSPLYEFGFVVTVATIFLINARHVAYSLSFAPRLSTVAPKRRWLYGILLTDEVYAVASAKLGDQPLASVKGFVLMQVLCHLSWIAGSLIGVLGGTQIGDSMVPIANFALSAMFAALAGLLIAGIKKEYKRICIIVSISSLLILFGLENIHSHPINILLSIMLSSSLVLFTRTSKQKHAEN